MSGAFEHSIKVPRLYKTAAKILQTVREDGASLKRLVYLKQHPNIKALYALALTSLRQGNRLDQIVRRTKILLNEPRLDAWLARVLITELLWGKGRLSSECKPVKTILTYEKTLREESKNVEIFESDSNESKKQAEKKPRYVRVNTLSMSVDEAIEAFEEEGCRLLYGSKDYADFVEAVSKLSNDEFIQDIHVPELLIFPAKTQFYNHPAYTNGAIILQDKASCLPAYLLNAQPGSTVLDMCAAPGMKTTHLASIMKNEGKIYAVEIDRRRYQTLCEIVASASCDCVETVNADVMTLGPERCPNVEYILVDPSCSGSGMVDRPGVDYNEEKCAPGRLRNLQSFQVIILRHALLDFPTVKRVVYSTCSLYQEENEQVIDEVLGQVGDAYRLLPAKSLMKENWFNYSSSDFNCGENCLYARPETDLSNGFFVAVFERDFDVPLPVVERRKKVIKKPLNDCIDKEEEKENEKEKEEEEKKEEKKIDDDNCDDKDETISNFAVEKNDKLNKRKNKKKKNNKKEKTVESDNSEKKKIDRRENCVKEKKPINEKGKDEEISENYYDDETFRNENKKSKRKRRESKEETEANVDNDEDKPRDDEITSKKKKKCKKSRNGDRELYESGKIGKDEVASAAVIQRKNKSKKSKRNNELIDETRNEEVKTIDDNNADNADLVVCKKKRKKNKL